MPTLFATKSYHSYFRSTKKRKVVLLEDSEITLMVYGFQTEEIKSTFPHRLQCTRRARFTRLQDDQDEKFK